MERLINFDPQWINDIVITGINIFILFFVMSYFLFNPAREVLEKRRKRIALFDLIHETIRQDKKEYNQKAYRQDIDMECKDFMKIM